MNKKALYVYGFIVITVVLTYFSFFYVPKSESLFINKIKSSYENNDLPLQVKDITDFEWDRLCVLHEWSITPETTISELEERYDIDFSTYKGRLPNMEGHRAIPYPYVTVGLVFSRDRKIVKFLKFKFPFFDINGKRYKILVRSDDPVCYNSTATLEYDEKISKKTHGYITFK